MFTLLQYTEEEEAMARLGYKAYRVRDGSDIRDPRLDRLECFDERSKSFPIQPLLASNKQRSYTWRCNVTLDQGREGACVGFGVCHELAARPAEVQGMSGVYAKQAIYWEAQKIDRWEGGSYPHASPYYEGTSVLAGVQVAQRIGWCEEYRWAFGIHDLILGVGHNGPAILGISWYEGMANVDSEGYIKPTGYKTGGHCILCKAVNVKKKRFTLHNSWGPEWGMNGDCYISFDDMEKLLYERGEALFLLHRHNLPRIDL